jgi:hypothetical protein
MEFRDAIDSHRREDSVDIAIPSRHGAPTDRL